MAVSSSAVLCALLVPLLAAGETLQCYVCSGLQDPGCNDPFNPKEDFKKPCDALGCYWWRVSNENFKDITVRTCGPPVWENLTDVPLGKNFSRETFICSRDYCNQSTHLSASAVLLVVPIISILFLHK